MANFELHKIDAIEFLKNIQDNSINCCITDLPYESLERHRSIGTTTRLKKEWFDIFPNNQLEILLTHLYRILKNNSHLYMFCDAETMFLVNYSSPKG